MKITALIPDKLIEDVQSISGGKNTTESLIIALQHYVSSKRMYDVLEDLDREPFTFREDFTAYGIRKINRDR
ncbi:MAG: DUF2191 domain-containing protein [Bacteroidota bacterium]